MNSKDIFQMCLQNLMRRKARTFLTVLGVFIGCCSIVIMVSLGIGMKVSQEKMLAQMGDLTIITVSPPQGGRGKQKLNDAAVKSFSALPGVTAVSPKLSLEQFSIKLYAGNNGRYVADWSTIAGMDMKTVPQLGYQALKGKKQTAAANEVLVGQYFAYNFADTMRPQGRNTIDRWAGTDDSGKELPPPDPYFDPPKEPLVLEIINGSSKYKTTLSVAGTIKEDYAKGSETSDGILMNLADIKKLIEQARDDHKKPEAYSSVVVKVKDITQVAAAEQSIKGMGYVTSSMESIRKPMEKEAKQKQMMLGGLGAISLFVAALGITNTMIMSISERTKEIGVMKALGCYVKDIRVMFLSEAAAIGFIGGVVGSVVSVLISWTINFIASGGASNPSVLWQVILGGAEISRISIVPLWLIAFAILFSIAIGLVSGYYPANKAVKISALEAIKNE